MQAMVSKFFPPPTRGKFFVRRNFYAATKNHLDNVKKFFSRFAVKVKGANFLKYKHDIPECPCAATTPPAELIAYCDIRKGVSYNALEKLKRCAGVITPDFSTNLDFPFPWKSRHQQCAPGHQRDLGLLLRGHCQGQYRFHRRGRLH